MSKSSTNSYENPVLNNIITKTKTSLKNVSSNDSLSTTIVVSSSSRIIRGGGNSSSSDKLTPKTIMVNINDRSSSSTSSNVLSDSEISITSKSVDEYIQLKSVIKQDELTRFFESEKTKEDHEKIMEMLGGRNTKLHLTTSSIKILSSRYLRTCMKTGKVIETPEEMFLRVSKSLAFADHDLYGKQKSDCVELAKDFYEMMINLEFTPAGRTLANAGSDTKLVANCVVLHPGDSMVSIMSTLKHAALLQKAGSGLGFPFHLLRPAGAIVKKSKGHSSGPVSFLRAYDSMFGTIKQHGRHGANMAVMSVDHPDIIEFILAKRKEGEIRNFNISVGLTDEFMRKVESKSKDLWMCKFNGETYKPRLIERDVQGRFISAEEIDITAYDIFQKYIVDSAWSNGEPGVVFLDTVNNNNPLPGLGRIEACNPCGEQFLHDGDVCNLGSINLEKMVVVDKTQKPEKRFVNWSLLKKVTRLAVHLLDNVIDKSEFPSERVRNMAPRNRRIGLGIMGFADMLFRLRIPYGSEDSTKLASEIMKCVKFSAIKKSEELAKEKGRFPNFDKSIYSRNHSSDGSDHKDRRNSALTCIAPTGSIAMMHDVSGGCEPHFAIAYHYENILDGKTVIRCFNKHLKQILKEHGFLDNEDILKKIDKKGSIQGIEEIPKKIRDVFVTSMDISASDHIKMQSTFQAHCDNSISKTINFPNSATKEEVSHGYVKAWKMKCRGCTVYRNGSRQFQVLNLNDDDGEDDVDDKDESLKIYTTELSISSSSSGSNDEEEDLFTEKYTPSKCPDCGLNTLIYSEGCEKCVDCGFSLCSSTNK